jgi:Cu/Ag efflux protein CusF
LSQIKAPTGTKGSVSQTTFATKPWVDGSVPLKAVLGTILAVPFVAASPALAQGITLDNPMVAAGKIIFEQTAGDVGCASCHGMGGQGDAGPDIRGRGRDTVVHAMENVVEMNFFKLTPPEVSQVVSYLQYLRHLYAGVGVLEYVDARAGRIFIQHDEIPDLMAAMVMSFQVDPPSLLESFSVGERVHFTFDMGMGAVVALSPEGTLSAPLHAFSTDATGALLGQVVVSVADNQLVFDVDADGLAPGKYAFHLFDSPTCIDPRGTAIVETYLPNLDVPEGGGTIEPIHVSYLATLDLVQARTIALFAPGATAAGGELIACASFASG